MTDVPKQTRPAPPFSAHLRAVAAPVWEAQLDHPLVRGIGEGTLDPEVFGFWLRQDYRFLIDYCRVFALAAARAPDLASMARFATLLTETIGGEMALHRSYVAEFGIGEADLEAEDPAPTTRGYADFLLRTAALGDFAELLGALLPCMWGYSELGQTLKARGLPPEPRYARWIETYADPGFAELAAWCRELLDAACEGLPPAALGRVEAAFLTSSRYELAFWEMAWVGERWAPTSVAERTAGALAAYRREPAPTPGEERAAFEAAVAAEVAGTDTE